jgi:hypothetical protein
MKHRALAAVLAAAIGLGASAPAWADGKATTRNIILFGGAAAGFLITNYNHKLREKRAEQEQVQRRQSAYREWFYKKYGYYPTQEQLERWYKQTYGAPPQQ